MKREIFEVTEDMMNDSINIIDIDNLEFAITTSIVEKKNQVFILNELVLVVFFKDGYIWCNGLLNEKEHIHFGLIEENNIQDVSFSLTAFIENIILKIENLQ